MTGMGEQFARSGSWADAVQRVNGLVAFLQEHPERLREIQQDAASLTGELTSPDGLVTVRVDAAGQLSDVQVAPDAFTRTAPDQLAQTVVDTARKAGQDVLVRRVELTKSLGKETTGWSAASPTRPHPADGRNAGFPGPAGSAQHRPNRPDEDDMPGSWLVDTDL